MCRNATADTTHFDLRMRRGIVAIRQHCDMNASVRPAGGPQAIRASPFSSMTSADTSAAPFDPSLTEPSNFSVRRWLPPFAVAIALLSALLTFVVLTGLTPIEPTRQVVRTFLLVNGATILLLVGIIV